MDMNRLKSVLDTGHLLADDLKEAIDAMESLVNKVDSLKRQVETLNNENTELEVRIVELEVELGCKKTVDAVDIDTASMSNKYNDAELLADTIMALPDDIQDSMSVSKSILISELINQGYASEIVTTALDIVREREKVASLKPEF